MKQKRVLQVIGALQLRSYSIFLIHEPHPKNPLLAGPKARRAFIAFVKEIHNADFTRWGAAGYWDEDYKPFSYFEGERVAASTCIYSMPSLVHGEWCKVAQVSSVGTLPEYRLQGLNRQLHEMALEEARAEHRFMFLFSDEDAIPFYRKLGFKSVDDFY